MSDEIARSVVQLCLFAPELQGRYDIQDSGHSGVYMLWFRVTVIADLCDQYCFT
jgi:hypothetical protein